MLTKSPSGALSPYYYKGGFFHGIHYGSYFGDSAALCAMIEQEERFILASPQRRRVLMDFYETELTPAVLERVVRHIGALEPRLVKLAIAAEPKKLWQLRRALRRRAVLSPQRLNLGTDMEEGKTWLVSDRF